MVLLAERFVVANRVDEAFAVPFLVSEHAREQAARRVAARALCLALSAVGSAAEADTFAGVAAPPLAFSTTALEALGAERARLLHGCGAAKAIFGADRE